jgi:hypothetical protein
MRPFYATADAVLKLSHYTKCGQTHKNVCDELGLFPLRHRYLGLRINKTFQRYVDHPDTAIKRAHAEKVVGPALTSCQADLVAATASAPKNHAITDIKTTAGMLCGHAVPGRDKFISCPTAENYALYDIMLDSLADERVIHAFALDVNCRYSHHLKICLPEVYKKIRKFIIGWLHSKAGHGLACQLKFSGLHVGDGLGRAIGEQAEQLWVRCPPSCMILLACVSYLSVLVEACLPETTQNTKSRVNIFSVGA